MNTIAKKFPMLLTSSDALVSEIPAEVVHLSFTLSNMIEDLGEMDMGDAAPVPITHDILEKIIVYMIHQHGLPDHERSSIFPKRKMIYWDMKFFVELANSPIEYLPYFDAIKFLDIPCLMNLFAGGFAARYILGEAPVVLTHNPANQIIKELDKLGHYYKFFCKHVLNQAGIHELIHTTCDCHYTEIECAAAHGNRRYLNAHLPVRIDNKITGNICTAAAGNGKLACLKMARERGCKWDSRTCTYAAANGYIECLKYAHEGGCPWNENTPLEASKNGHLECFKYAHENGCRSYKYLTTYTAANGHFECLKYAHEHGYGWCKYTPFSIFVNDQKCLEYIFEHGYNET